MCFTADELLLLHKNVNRLVGNEIFASNLLANNDQWVLSSIQKLIDNDTLIKSQEFDISIKKLNVSQLRDILVENNLPKSGNKNEIINRIKKNYYTIDNLELPTFYKATQKGKKIINETTYLLEFTSNMHLTPTKAYYIARNYINNDSEDKVIEIYKFEIHRLINTKFETADFAIWRLIDYYKNKKRDYNNARKYSNILYYKNLEKFINDLRKGLYDDYENGAFDEERIEEKLHVDVNHLDSDIYEYLVIDENLSVNQLFELFKNDISKIIDSDIWNDTLFYYFVELIKRSIIATGQSSVYSKILDWINTNHTPKIDEYEYHYEENINLESENDMDNALENCISLNIDELLEIKDDITFYIDKTYGDIIPVVKESRLKIITSDKLRE